MCILVIVLNLVAFLHSGLVTIRDTEAIIRPKPTNYSQGSKFKKFFSPAVSRASSQSSESDSESGANAINHYPGMQSAQSARSLRSAMERSSLFSNASMGDLTKAGQQGTDVDRLDRERCVRLSVYMFVYMSFMSRSIFLSWLAVWMTSRWWRNCGGKISPSPDELTRLPAGFRPPGTAHSFGHYSTRLFTLLCSICVGLIYCHHTYDFMFTYLVCTH
jgi:hypothetical protein